MAGSMLRIVGISVVLLTLCLRAGWSLAAEPPAKAGAPPAAKPAMPVDASLPSVARLSLDEAVALFLRENLSLLMTKFGIDQAKGQQITSALFPNPYLTIGTLSAYTQGQTMDRSGQITTQVQQLFEMAGKRGFRIESAAFGAKTAEANFEDTIRQLSFTVKDAYYRVQLAQRRLALAEENRDRFARILEVNTIRFKKGYIAEVDLIRIRL
ncbi:MAG: TolC family protein, partial [Nitrospirota bacterium]|nr:TolC family protein [Nitrospirota bacterium]